MGEAKRCVVFFSGGLMSWAAAKRAVVKYGAENTTLLFTDTLIEDADLYRFLEDAAVNVGARLVKIADGRSPWEVFRDKKLIGNGRKDPCSEILKRNLGREWLKANVDPNDTALVFGISWDEDHRFDGKPLKAGGQRRGVKNVYGRLGYHHVEAPLLESPWLKATDVRTWARLEGLRIPRLYDLGFLHNNCGGFCVKAGEGHFVKLLDRLPEVYASHEAEEAAFNAARPGMVRQTVLAPKIAQPDGTMKRVPMSMAEFREAVTGGLHVDMFNEGGCGCFLDEAEAA